MSSEFILKKELGKETVNGVEFTKVSKFHFYSPYECLKKFEFMNDSGYDIMMRISKNWKVITYQHLVNLCEKVKTKVVPDKVKNYKRINVDYYENNAVERWRFDYYCKRNGFDIKDFEETKVVSGKVSKYVYKRKRG